MSSWAEGVDDRGEDKFSPALELGANKPETREAGDTRVADMEDPKVVDDIGGS
jgi:hypothetical protein